MSEQPFAQADAEWLELTRAAREWLASPLGELLLTAERQALDEEIDIPLGTDVNAARWLVKYDNLRTWMQHFGKRKLLLVAAGE